jgi:parvulin-like peptidyl-prolyl isomerase
MASDPIIARGKQVEVRRSQFDEAMSIYKSQLARETKSEVPADQLQAKLLDHLIVAAILTAKADDNDRKLATEMTEQTLANVRQRFATDDDFAQQIGTMGMTLRQYRQHLLEQNICEGVIDREIKANIAISGEAVKRYYDENSQAFDKPEQVHARQILLATTDLPTQQPLPADQQKHKEELAKQIRSRLDQGEDFGKLASEFSDDLFSKEATTTDLPLYVRGQMPPEFDAAAFSLKPFQISDVVRSKLGFHIIQVIDHQPATKMKLEEVGDRIREFLTEQEVKERLPKYLEKLKEDASVQIISVPATEAAY